MKVNTVIWHAARCWKARSHEALYDLLQNTCFIFCALHVLQQGSSSSSLSFSSFPDASHLAAMSQWRAEGVRTVRWPWASSLRGHPTTQFCNKLYGK